MNPFDTLVLDEPPLRLTPEQLLRQGRKTVRRRRLAGVASGAGLALGAAALAVPAFSSEAKPPARLLTEPTATPAPASESDRVVAALRAAVPGKPVTDVVVGTKPRVKATVGGAVVAVDWAREADGVFDCGVQENVKTCVVSKEDGSRAATGIAILLSDNGEHAKRVVQAFSEDEVLVSVQAFQSATGDLPWTADEQRAVAIAISEALTR